MEAATAIARPGLQKPGPDPRVEAHDFRDALHVDPWHILGDVGYRVDVTDLRRQESVARILRQLCRFWRGHDRRRGLPAMERVVELFEAIRRFVVHRSDNEPFRV